MTVVAGEPRTARALRAPSCQAAKGLRHRIGSDEFGEREVPFMPWGLQNRLARIIRPSDGHTVMLAADHGYFLGPTHKLEIPRKTLNRCSRSPMRSWSPEAWSAPRSIPRRASRSCSV